MPLLIPHLALGMELLPRPEDARSTSTYLWISLILAGCVVATGWLENVLDGRSNWIFLVVLAGVLVLTVSAIDITKANAAVIAGVILAVAIMGGMEASGIGRMAVNVAVGTSIFVVMAVGMVIIALIGILLVGAIASIPTDTVGAFVTTFLVIVLGIIVIGGVIFLLLKDVVESAGGAVEDGVAGSIVKSVADTITDRLDHNGWWGVAIGLPMLAIAVFVGITRESAMAGAIASALFVVIGGFVVILAAGMGKAMRRGKASFPTIFSAVALACTHGFLLWYCFLGGWRWFGA